ncbi:MAG: hypothetical protein EXS30_11325 [Pedosphaera sp.]|nr:hypothetical protein [Pedosphaera sp.]
MKMNLQAQELPSLILPFFLAAVLALSTIGCGRSERIDAGVASAQELEKLREENKEVQKFRNENQELPRLRKENEEAQRLRVQLQELARLRKENDDLRSQIAQFQQTNRQAQPSKLRPTQP